MSSASLTQPNCAYSHFEPFQRLVQQQNRVSFMIRPKLGTEGRASPSQHLRDTVRCANAKECAWDCSWNCLYFRMGLRETVGNDAICGGVKRQSDVRARNLEINGRASGDAVMPIHDAIVASVDGGLKHRLGHLAVEGKATPAGAHRGVASWQYARPMLCQYPLAYGFCGAQDGLVSDIAAKRRGERD